MTAPDHEADARALLSRIGITRYNSTTDEVYDGSVKEIAAALERAFAAGRRAGVEEAAAEQAKRSMP